MEDYNFWQDFFDTYQSLSDVVKALWLLVPPAFLLGLVALLLRHRVAQREAEHGGRGDLLFTVHRDDDGALRVYRHGRDIAHQPALVLLESPEGNRLERQNHSG